MSDRIDIKAIPGYVILGDGRTRLVDWFQRLDAIADGGTSDGFFTEENLSFFTGKSLSELRRIDPTAANFRRFQTRSFADFRSFIDSIIASQRCSDPLEVRRRSLAARDGPEEACISPPPPNPPPMPVDPPARKKPAKRVEVDISSIDDDYPEWFFEETPPSPAASEKREGEPHLPNIDERVSRLWEPRLDRMADEFPETGRTNGPQISVRFDGRNFIMDFTGCYVDPEDETRCVRPWSFFILHLKNVTGQLQAARREGPLQVSRRSDARGSVRISVRAEVGDQIKVFGTDSITGSRSLNTIYYFIREDGSVEVEETLSRTRAHEESATPMQKVAAGVGMVLPQLGVVLNILTDPVRAMREHAATLDLMRSEGECYMTAPDGTRYKICK